MKTNKRDRIKSVQTLFDIVEAIKELDGAKVTQIADHLGIAKSTVSLHLRTLEENGYIVNTGSEYDIGLGFLDMGKYAQEKKQIYSVAKPHLKELAKETEETAWCMVEENGYGIFLDRETGKYSIQTDARVGTRMPLHHSTGGRAIMGHLPTDRVEEILDLHGLPSRMEGTVETREELFRELEEIQKRGLAFNKEELVRGLHVVGAPVIDQHDNVVGAVSVSGAANRMPAHLLENEIAEKLLAAVNEIELELIYS